jgi:hypothetical protein
MKEKSVYTVQEDCQVPQNSTVSDQIVCFPRLAREGEAPVLFRRVEIRGAEKDETKRLTLKKGPNVVRAAIINGGGATDFCARFLDADDQPLKGLVVSVGEVRK